MPNHVRNVLKFSKLKPNERNFVLERFTTEMEDDIYPLNKIFDFDTIIPEPRLESECPEDCKVNKDSHVEEDKERPWFDWYVWRNKYWGTKWGAYDGYVKVGNTVVTFVFSTAWSAPIPIYEQLAKKYPDLTWEVRYADEDIGSNCGIIQYNHNPGELDYYGEREISHPEQFARRIWNNY